MMSPGDPLLVCEVSPALFSAVAANEAERAAPGVTLVDVSMIGLAGRIYLLVRHLQRQFAAYLGTPTRARGYPPFEGEHSLIVEVAPGLAIERVTDLALRAVPAVEPGILFVERQFGVLEVHAPALADVERAGQAILAGLGADAADQLRPKILFSESSPASPTGRR